VNEAPQPDATLVEDEAAAEALVARLSRAPRLAFDSEGDGMFRYRARLCAIQLASEREIAIVDTLLLDARHLARLLAASGPEKVVHDVAFDARLLFAHGVTLGSVFDTAIAARFLGFSATGLSSLIARLFDVELPKDKQQADWGARPLDDASLAYLANDVRYLLPLHDLLLEQLREKGIEPELREECAWVLAEAQRPVREPSFLGRVKGAAARPAHQRARVYELSRARDALARELDVPPGRLLAGELVLRLAELENLSDGELTRRLSSLARPYASRFLEALANAAARDDAPADELIDDSHIPSATELALRKRRRELLSAFRTREAEAREVDLQVVLPGHCLAELTKLPTLEREALERVPGLGACRIERYGERWRSEFAARWS
jgi:ribonuclease D